MRFPWQKKIETKENPVGAALYVASGQHYKPWKREEKAKEGYAQNVVVYRAIREIATACSSIHINLKQNGEIVESHPVIDLLKQPNPTNSYVDFINNLFIDYLINGEMFLSVISAGMPQELWAHNPLFMRVKPGMKGIPDAYIYEQNGKKIKFDVDSVTGESDMFFLKMYNPLDYWRGIGPLDAAALAGDTHNQGMKWNYSLLVNGARPSGLVTMEGSPSGEVVNRLREFFKSRVQGSSNAGEVPLLTDGAQWQEMGSNPKDMDFINTMKETSKYIASAFGVPLPLIDNDASTFNNVEQAKERLWTDTVLPLFERFLISFGNWLLPRYGEGYEFCIDMDSIQALEPVRQRRFDRIVQGVQAGLMTIDEGREKIGLDPRGGAADELLVSSNLLPLDFTTTSFEQEEKRYSDKLEKLGYSKKEITELLSDARNTKG